MVFPVKIKEKREGDHLKVAKPEGPPHTSPSWARLRTREEVFGHRLKTREEVPGF